MQVSTVQKIKEYYKLAHEAENSYKKQFYFNKIRKLEDEDQKK